MDSQDIAVFTENTYTTPQINISLFQNIQYDDSRNLTKILLSEEIINNDEKRQHKVLKISRKSKKIKCYRKRN